MHATQQEIDKATALGYQIYQNKDGTFAIGLNGVRRIWHDATDWYSANSIRSKYEDKQRHNNLSDALERPITKEG